MGSDVLAHQIIPLVEALESYGADADRALALAGLSRADIADPNTRLDDSFEQRIWDASIEVTGDAQIGLRLAPSIRAGTLGAYEYLLRNAGSLGETIDWADRYMRLVDMRSRITVRSEGEVAVLRVWRPGGMEFVPAAIECLFGVIALLAHERISPELGMRSVSFKHQATGAQSTYAETFGCPIHFGAIDNEIEIPASAMQAKMIGADPGLGAVLRTHVQGLLESAPPADSIVEDARRLLSERLATGKFAVEDLAKALHVGARTLRRRLEAANTSYTALLDDVRRDRAAHYVARTDESLAQVAAMLGFSDPSTFYRAFKRWTSMTPAQYRKQARS